METHSKASAQTTTNADGTSTTLITGPITTEEKAQKKNDVKARKYSAPSTESLDSIFNRLQKIVRQLAYLGENISQEELNLKFFEKSALSEWIEIARGRVTQLDLTSPRWSVSTVTRRDTLQGNAEDLGTKIAGKGIKTALEGLITITSKGKERDRPKKEDQGFDSGKFQAYDRKQVPNISTQGI
ncbi:hypothetical protein Tco_1284244 [Tanacetum coccineum]